jgi:hypothetical protein
LAGRENKMMIAVTPAKSARNVGEPIGCHEAAENLARFVLHEEERA